LCKCSSTNLFKELEISIYLNLCDTVTYCLMVGNEDSIQQKTNIFLKWNFVLKIFIDCAQSNCETNENNGTKRNTKIQNQKRPTEFRFYLVIEI
jgi:hypothetical protein